MTFVDRLRRLAEVIGSLEHMHGAGTPKALEAAGPDDLAVLAAFSRALGPALDEVVADMRAYALPSTAAWMQWLLEGVDREVGTPPPDEIAELVLRIVNIGARFGGVAPS